MQPVACFLVHLQQRVLGGDAIFDGAPGIDFVLHLKEETLRINVFSAAHLVAVSSPIYMQVIQCEIRRIKIQRAVMAKPLTIHR